MPSRRCHRVGAADSRALCGFCCRHKLGVDHVAKFADEPRSHAEWDAWGYHVSCLARLHGHRNAVSPLHVFTVRAAQLHGPAFPTETPAKTDDEQTADTR